VTEKSDRKTKLTLGQYVHRRNGVPLGASGALSNMLYRSFTADSLTKFWQYWNPIWGYYLSKLVFAPINRYLPRAVAVVMTFLVSGVVHDLAVFALTGTFTGVISVWFLILGMVVMFGQVMHLNYSKLAIHYRVLIHLVYLGLCFAITIMMMAKTA